MDENQLDSFIGKRLGASDLKDNLFLNERFDRAVARLYDQ